MIFFIILLIVSIYFSILDLRNRRIPIKNFKILFLISLFFIFFTFNSLDSALILLFLLQMIFLFFFCFIFYVLNFIGGGDAKYIFFISIYNFCYSFEIVNLIDFFSIFILIYFSLLIPNLAKNQFYSRSLYEQFLIFFNRKCFFIDFYLKLCFKFFPLKSINKIDDIKYKIKSFLILFDFKTGNFYFISQYKMPVIIVCFLAYLFYLTLNFCVF